MNSPNTLSLEQQFKVQLFANQVQNLSQEEVKELIVDLYETSLLQQRAFEKIMGEFLGLSPSGSF